MTDSIKNYNKYKINNTNYTIDEICNPPKFILQPQQQFLPEYLYDHINKINGLLIFHNIGSLTKLKYPNFT